MSGRSSGRGSSQRQRRRHETSNVSLQERYQKFSNFRNKQENRDENCAHWMVPVFGVAAAASIALYTRYLKDLKRKAAAVKHVENKAFRTSRKLVDLSLTAKNGTLVKSKSAFV